ncbi:hypothetical protein EKN06_08340 [Croceicoccus ponticola]|uniref:Uncharacterized protein n=1 Tax=Croceicoccus ponticola TaxID=2217664 RepID=A0A437GX22_9SPHN|nr:hypothetical protein [Croceicoccus ponticola]RVQ66948.1 hypothetical protein EKN06_08340 [Croceicoccus ponticola]
MTLEILKGEVRSIGKRFPNREERARRLFITERPASLSRDQDREFRIKTEISQQFSIPYTAVSFCGSAQIGFSVHKDQLFQPGVSDLDAACIDAQLFQRAWIDVIETTRAFTDLTPFGHRTTDEINVFREQIVKRGMIRVDAMPLSETKTAWSTFQGRVSRKHTDLFKRISLAIYLNEYAFCWKQDSSLATVMR